MQAVIHGALAIIGWITVPLVPLELLIGTGLLPLRILLMRDWSLITTGAITVLLLALSYFGAALVVASFLLLGLYSWFGAYLAAAFSPLNRPPWLRNQTIFEAAALLNRLSFWASVATLVRGVWLLTIG
jgi:hypothetical protein